VTILLIILGAVLVVAGLVGCVLPVLPGPPLGVAGLVLLWLARGWEAATFGGLEVAILAALAVGVTVPDFVLPAIGAKRYGASKSGVWGSVLGMIVGMFTLGPFGMLIGAFLGALAFEVISGKESGPAMRAAWGVFVGTVAGIVMKLAVSGAITVFFVREVFAG
jgi:uncharacterized protein YqgC (DUF456 family)